MDRETTLIDLWKAEAQALFEEQRRGLANATRMIGIGAALVTGIASAAVAARQIAVALPLPAALCLLLALQLQIYADVSAIGEARLGLERALALQLGAPALVYESFVVPTRRREGNLSIRLSQLFYSSLALGAVVAGGVIAWRSGLVIFVVYVAPTIVAAALPVLAYLELRHARRRVRVGLRKGVPLGEVFTAAVGAPFWPWSSRSHTL